MKRSIQLGLMAVAFWGVAAIAADHIDSPAAVAEPAADITDIYAWITADKTKINMIINVNPNATTASKFSDAIKYIFHVSSHADAATALTTYTAATNLACSFTEDQLVTCELGETTVIDEKNASAVAGVESADSSLKIFTGLRDDPFFMAFTEFTNTTKAVKDAVPDLIAADAFNAAGCPTLDAGTRDALAGTLTGGSVNTFAGQNVLSIVVQANLSLFGAGPFYNVSASTRRI